MKEPYVPTLLHLRTLVAFLGESAQYAWWPTSFYENSSRLFLDPVFAKTFRLCQYHGVLEAARILHDEHLSVGSYHLFRFPEELEQDLHALLQSTTGEDLVNEASQSKEAALEALEQLASKNRKLSVGPIAVGSVKDLGSSDALSAIASAYISAFTQNAKTYPYLAA